MFKQHECGVADAAGQRVSIGWGPVCNLWIVQAACIRPIAPMSVCDLGCPPTLVIGRPPSARLSKIARRHAYCWGAQTTPVARCITADTSSTSSSPQTAQTAYSPFGGHPLPNAAHPRGLLPLPCKPSFGCSAAGGGAAAWHTETWRESRSEASRRAAAARRCLQRPMQQHQSAR